MILGGDLGGTKTLLALAEPGDGRPRIVREERFDSRAYPRFEDLLAAFLRGETGVDSACFGVAGPTDGRQAQLTNLPWRIDAGALEKSFGIGRARLVNDFASAAHGLELLEPPGAEPGTPLETRMDTGSTGHAPSPAGDRQTIVTLQTGTPREQAPRLLLGAGTGLGVAGLVWQEGHYRVVPGEGGHLGFAPGTPQAAELWRWLFDQSGRVTMEDVVAGPGLARIYRFLSGQDKTPAEVGAAALAGTDPFATETLEIWLGAYGAFAGDLALQWLAYGGVFIAGGIAAKLFPYLSLRPFLDAFKAKRQHRPLAEAMPVYLVTEERLGLLGALAIAHAATA